MDNKDLDAVLNARGVPEPPSNLSARIIDAAKRTPQNVPFYKVWARRVFKPVSIGSFQIQKPALAFAMVAFLLVGGLFISSGNTLQEANDDVSLAFYLDDIFEVDDL